MKLIPNGMSRSITHQMLVAKKNSPHIFFGVGVVGVVTSAVLACRATLKLEEKLDEIDNDLKEVKHRSTKLPETGEGYSSEQEYRRDLIRVYAKSGLELGKLYGPSVVLGVISIGALSGSHVQMSRRNSALTATAAGLSKAYEEYRERVREAVGEERESDIHDGITTEKKMIDGKKVDVKTKSKTGGSAFSFMFTNQSSWNWKNDAYYNRTFLEAQQNHFNMQLQMKGYVILNDVLDSLGMEKTREGMINGWVYDRDLQNEGANYIDFGIFSTERNIQFQNGDECDVFLDFNVDGVIYDKI